MAAIFCSNCRSSNVRRDRNPCVNENNSKMFGRTSFRCEDRGWWELILVPCERVSHVTNQQSYVLAPIFKAIEIFLIPFFDFRDARIEMSAKTLLAATR